MSNMGYCRFENTYNDLQDCSEHLEDKDLDESEERKRKLLIKLCKEIAGEFEE